MPITSILLLGLLVMGMPQDSAADEAGEPPKDFVFERGEGLTPVRVPRAETLEFRVHVDYGILGATVGKVTMSSKVEPYRHSLVLGKAAKEGEEELETGHFVMHAEGNYTLYSVDATIETRLLPQEWPRFSYLSKSQGTEKRRREILVGRKDDKEQSSYRQDTSRGAPKGTRIWREPRFRDVPVGTIDLMTGLYLTRSLVRDDLRFVRFPLIDKDRLWQMRLSKGKGKRMKTAAGTFDVVQILLEPTAYPGEEMDEDDKARFQGLFGIQGAIQLWAERRTGIPVRIQGDLPLGPLTLGIDVELERFDGTPPAFQPLGE